MTPEDARIIDLRKAGWSCTNIAHELDTNVAHVQYVCKKAGVTAKQGYRAKSVVKSDIAQYDDRIIALRAEGWSGEEIAEELGISKDRVYYVARRERQTGHATRPWVTAWPYQ